MQINVVDVDADGRALGTSTTFALSGQVRAMGESDDSLNRLCTKAGRMSCCCDTELRSDCTHSPPQRLVLLEVNDLAFLLSCPHMVTWVAAINLCVPQALFRLVLRRSIVPVTISLGHSGSVPDCLCSCSALQLEDSSCCRDRPCVHAICIPPDALLSDLTVFYPILWAPVQRHLETAP